MKCITTGKKAGNILPKVRLAFLFIFIVEKLSGFYSCSKSNSGTLVPPADSVDVYIAGIGFPAPPSVNTIAEIWKNGKRSQISSSGSLDFVTGIFVSNNDVYLSGYESAGFDFVPKYWKNGVAVVIKDTMNFTSGIAVSGNDVYVSGTSTSVSGSKSIAEYWKNGIGMRLSDGSKNAFTSGIFISDGDVYIVGNEDSVIKLWVNGVARDISSKPVIGYAGSLFVLNNDVYIAGNAYDPSHTNLITPRTGKNGVEVTLSKNLMPSIANAIVVSGTDVYTSGIETVFSPGLAAARYWKNSDQINLTDGATQPGLAYAIAVHGNNIYVAGSEGDTAKYWLNGKAVNLPSGVTGADRAYAIAISKR